MGMKGQTAMEYLMMLGAVIGFLLVVVLVTRTNILGSAAENVNETTGEIGGVLDSVQPRAPLITDVAEDVSECILGDDIALISWTTNIPSTSSVNYLIPGNPDEKYSGSQTLVTSHSVALTCAVPGFYDYTIASCTSTTACSSTDGDFTA